MWLWGVSRTCSSSRDTHACILDAATGALRWRFPFGQRGPTVNAATPVVPAAGRLFVTAAYGISCVCADFDRNAATPKWEAAGPLASQYCTPIVSDDHLYGIDGRDDVPPAGLDVLARCRPLPGTLRALPALAAGRLYIRDDTTLTCLDVGP